MATSVYIVDDHKVFREGISAILSYRENIEVVGTASSLEELQKDIFNLKPEVILMDLTLKDGSGLEITKWIVDQGIETAVLVFSMHSDIDMVKKVLTAGAKGYLLKDAGTEEMVNAIGVVKTGSTYYSPEVSRVLLQEITNPTPQKKADEIEELTKREVEVLKLIVNEKSNREIAEMLYVSPRTVDTHRRNILSKLNVKNTVGLVKFAIEKGLVETK